MSIYVLRRPDGRPFYVGKGIGDRVLAHENEARHPNDRKSNAYKLNVIRSIWRSDEAVVYEIDFITEDEDAAYARESEIISKLKRLHEGGPLTNLASGGGSSFGVAPVSKEQHSATLGGIPDDNPDRAILNGFVLSIATMKSVILKPVGQFTFKPQVFDSMASSLSRTGMSPAGQVRSFGGTALKVCSWGKSGRNLAKSEHHISSVVFTRRFESSLRAPLHASDCNHRYLDS